MSELTTATLGRTTEREALLTAADLAGLLLPNVLTWRVYRDRDGIVVDGQLCNDSPADLADWSDVLERSRVSIGRVEGVPFGTIAVTGVYGGVLVHIWTAISRPVGGAT